MKARFLFALLLSAGVAFAADFNSVKLSGTQPSLIHDTKIENYRFGKNGVVLAEFGQKNGPITGPALRWAIEDGVLVVSKDDAVREKLELVEQSEEQLKVRRHNGDISLFRFTRDPR